MTDPTTELAVAPELSEVMLDMDSDNAQYSALGSDMVVLVEFCESEGPKPVLFVPNPPDVEEFGENTAGEAKTGSSHVNLDDLALMLMTGDAQMRNASSKTTSDDSLTFVFMSVEEQGLWLISAGFCLRDVGARGHVRQFALAVLSPDRQKLRTGFGRVTEQLNGMIDKLVECNRALYVVELERSKVQAKKSETELANGDVVQSTDSRDDEVPVDNLLQTSQFPCLNVHKKDMLNNHEEGQVINSRSHLNNNEYAKLRPFQQIVSCIYSSFVIFLNDLVTQMSPPGSLFMDLPWLSGITEGGDSWSKWDSDSGFACSESITAPEISVNPNESTILSPLVPCMPDLIFAFLTGRQVVVAGSQMRRKAVTEVVEQLCQFLVNSAPHNSTMIWNESDLNYSLLERYHLVGQYVEPSVTLSESKHAKLVYILDLNSNQLSGLLYRHGLLDRLKTAKRLNRCSDRCLSSVIRLLHRELSLLAFALYHLLYKDQEAYRANIRGLSQICKLLNCTASDLHICKWILGAGMGGDFVRMNGVSESLFLTVSGADSDGWGVVKLK